MSIFQQHTRLITGLLLCAVLAGALFLGGWYLRSLIMLVSVLGMWEFLSIYWPQGHMGRKIIGALLAIVLVAGSAFGDLWTILTLAICFWAVGMMFLFSYGTGKTDIRLGHFSPIAHGLIYVPLILQLALHLSTAEQCLVMLAAIASDTGGYYMGKLIGRHHIWPSVSPKKTWEGSLGGTALCVIICIAMGIASAELAWALPAMPLWGWALLGVLLNITGQLGDFFESALKRTLSVKDSSNILPGHGGILDRVDSVLFVLPMYMLVRTILAATATAAVVAP